MNKAQLIGNLGKDPEIRTMQNGEKVCSLTVATSDKWKDKQTGERKEATEWHRVTMYNAGLIEVVEKYLRKGSKVYIEGQIKTRKWQDQSGADRYSTEIVLGRFNGGIEMLDRAPEREETPAPPPSQGAPAGYPDDDEIPF